MYAKPALVKPRFACDLDALAGLWITRLFASFTSASQLVNGLCSEELRQMIGIQPTEGKLSSMEIRPLLKSRAQEFEQLLPKNKSVLIRNIEFLSELLNLDAVQQDVLAFVALSEQHPFVVDVLEEIRSNSIDALSKMLCTALKTRDAEIRKAIRTDGPLFSIRLVCIESSRIGRHLQLAMPSSIRTALFTPASSLEELMAAFLEHSPSPKLSLDAFPHLKQETDLLLPYFLNAGNSDSTGNNVLVFGVAGSGKTEYVRALAKQLGKRLYQVRATDDRGDAINGLDRLAFFQVMQRFLQNSDALILFDEIEDVFPVERGYFTREPVAGKMYINRILENNPVPAIWVCNSVCQIDAAYLRRFDYSVAMCISPMAVRQQILTKYLRGYGIPKETLAYLSRQENLSPSQIEKAAKFLKLSGQSGAERETTLLHVIENSMALLDQEKTELPNHLADAGYQIDYLNADCDLLQLVAQFKQAPNAVGALCFYGAPGTGKSALAHYLAQEMGLPLLVRRASDVVRAYVGETEQNIAEMFTQAKEDGALLLLDEADSFLRDRKHAKHSWEITAVNEMLTQMEQFDGLFICSTNLMQSLDQASLRRFALKIKFDFLKPEQRWQLFVAQTKKIPAQHGTRFRAALDQLTNLTPGDFATVRRQAKLLGVRLTPDEMLKRLTQESKTKGNAVSRPIGFINAH